MLGVRRTNGWLAIGGVALASAIAIGACSSFSGTDTAPDSGDASESRADAGNDSDTADHTAPDPGLDSGSNQKDATPLPPLLVFVSSLQHTGYFGDGSGGLAGADAFCADLAADAGGLSNRKWVAWLSNSQVDARERLAPGGKAIEHPYTLMNDSGVVFPAGYTFVDAATPEISLELDENGALRPDVVWTGTNPHGLGWSGGANQYCNDWTSADSGSGLHSLYGSSSTNGAGWTNTGTTTDCAFLARIYCFELP